MKKRIIVASVIQMMTLGFCGSSAWAEAGDIPVGNMKLVPTVTLSEAHNDNVVLKETNLTSSWVTKINPGFTLNADDGANKYSLGYNLSDSIYHQSHGDDVLNHFFDLSAELGLTRKLLMNFNAHYNLTHDPRGSIVGAAGNVTIPDAYHETMLSGVVDYGVNSHLIVNGEFINKRYTNNHATTGARDKDTGKVGLEFDYKLTGKTLAILEARYQRFNYLTAPVDSSEQSYFTGLKWDATAKTSGSVRLGYLKKNFTKASLANGGFFSWELSAEWLPMTYSSWTLSGSSKSAESDGTGNYVKNTKVNVLWAHSWSEQLSHSISVGYTKGAYNGIVRNDKTTTVNASVTYQWLRWLAIKPAYDFLNLSSSTANSSYKNNVWSINLMGTL